MIYAIITGLVIVLCVLIICITIYKVKTINLTDDIKKLYIENTGYMQNIMDKYIDTEDIQYKVDRMYWILDKWYTEFYNEKIFDKNNIKKEQL